MAARDVVATVAENAAIVDPHGNRIEFIHAQENGSDAPLLASLDTDVLARDHFELRRSPTASRSCASSGPASASASTFTITTCLPPSIAATSVRMASNRSIFLP